MDSISSSEKTKGTLKLVDLHEPGLFVNRELGLLEFQRRVLEEAEDPTNPLLERVKFLSIVGSNLDEFFMVRVAGLTKQIETGALNVSADGLTAAEQLATIRKIAMQIMSHARNFLNHELLPALSQAGIYLKNYTDLDDRQKESVDKYFDEVIFPIVTPLGFDPGHPFPHISNLSLNLAIMVRDDQGKENFAHRINFGDARCVPVFVSNNRTYILI